MERREPSESGLWNPVPSAREQTAVSLAGVRIVEVGGGTGSLASFLLRTNRDSVPGLLGMLLTTDYQPLARGDTLALAREDGIKCLGDVDANAIDKYLPPESVDLMISANCYNYGLAGYGGRHDWRFIEAAYRVLRPGGCLVMVLRSNLLHFWLKAMRTQAGFTNGDLKRHNREAVNVHQALLPTVNHFGPVDLKHLEFISNKFQLVITFSHVTPPPKVVFTAFADAQLEGVEELHGFNVQILFWKCDLKTWQQNSKPRYHPALPFWSVLPGYLAQAPEKLPPEIIDDLVVTPIQDDGHCLFRAITNLLGDESRHAQLRAQTADAMLEDLASLSRRARALTAGTSNFRARELRNAHHNIVWGGDPEIMFISFMLRRRIVVHRPGLEPLTFDGFLSIGAEQAERPLLGGALHLYHRAGAHFDALRPQD